MSELDTTIGELREQPGVTQVLLAGRDGLLVHHAGEAGLDRDAIAALTPGLAAACTAVGDAAEQGAFVTAAIEWAHGVGIVSAVSDELLLVVLLAPGVGFADLLRLIRDRRDRLADAWH